MAKLRRDKYVTSQRTLHEYYQQGVTKAEFDKLDGLTPTTTELNYTDGVTSAIQTQLSSATAIGVTNMVTAAGPTGHYMNSSTFANWPGVTIATTPTAQASRVMWLMRSNVHINSQTVSGYHRTGVIRMTATHPGTVNDPVMAIRCNKFTDNDYEDRTELLCSVDHPNGTSAYTYQPQIKSMQDTHAVYGAEAISSGSCPTRIATFEMDGGSTINWS